MAVEMNGSVDLGAPPEVVWKKLNDPETLKSCIPGCETLELDGANAFVAAAVLKIGPMKAKFKGRVELSDLDPPHGYRISGEGQGGIAGYAKGGAVVRLTPLGAESTTLSYEVTANVGGKIAQLGARLLDSVAKKYADQFFASFAATMPSIEPHVS
ncbi:CoxG family protein [Sphingobium lactosutens]|uniref:Carbon monoxide dehydrogenase n=1 Tax=Sphingobium lactosutens DS20 TaxID=1331060 RepID=T0H684_9SPHN|nr:SRPBCC domain-containing protein [Sphingobium lactosutens]EQB11806.1 hypothetical protein RLDS_22010 [Sphingobium lactosutens DS20]